MNETKKVRSSNIELLRVVAMFMIILFHITHHCIIPQLTDANTPMVSYFAQPAFHKRLLLLDWLNTLGIISNGIFILISGYFMANREGAEIKLSRISQKLLLQLGFAAPFRGAEQRGRAAVAGFDGAGDHKRTDLAADRYWAGLGAEVRYILY